VRHGESAGNLDTSLYSTTPDSLIPLTSRGFVQATECGKRIRGLIGDEKATFYVSPYMRTRQTLMSILEAFKGVRSVEVTTEPRIREQDFGNFQDTEAMKQVYKDRRKFGRFYYRFPNGEAGTDVYDRVAEFWSTLYRFIDGRKTQSMPENIICVTHGLLLRIFCMCYFRWTVTEFEQVWNPGNCEAWVLERKKTGRYRLAGALGPRGKFIPIKFGANQRQKMYDHMREPRASRSLTPGQALEDECQLTHLRVPGAPVEDARGLATYCLDGCDWQSVFSMMPGGVTAADTNPGGETEKEDREIQADADFSDGPADPAAESKARKALRAAKKAAEKAMSAEPAMESEF